MLARACVCVAYVCEAPLPCLTSAFASRCRLFLDVVVVVVGVLVVVFVAVSVHRFTLILLFCDDSTFGE